MKEALIVIGVLMTATACIDETDLALPSARPQIVVDAVISTTASESYLKIGWTSEVNASCTDDFGTTIRCDPGPGSGLHHVNGTARIFESDEVLLAIIPFRMVDKAGETYLDLNISGTPGSTYTLQIDLEYKGDEEHYTARTTMLPTPPITDITYTIRKGDVGKSDNLVPLISFTDPPERNFYLFRLCAQEGGIYCGNSRVWPYSLIADTFLPSNVTNLSIDDGAAIAKYAEFYPRPHPGTGVQVRMYSVDENTYFFYKGLIDQFNNDGGAYTPTPSTPRGNVSGDGIGLFRAIQESRATVYY